MRTVIIVALAGVGLMAGCGGGDGMTGGDGGVTIDGTVNTGTTAERETAARSNDDKASAETVSVGTTVEGTVGAFVAGMGSDQDFYKINVTAPTLLKLTVSARNGGDYNAFAQLLHTQSSISNVVRGEREIFLPRPGDYHIQVADLRNVGATPMNVGGATSTYSLKIEKLTPAPVVVTLPLTAAQQMLTVPADGKIVIYEFTAPKPNRIKIETRASRLTPKSNVDTVVYFMDATSTPISQIDYSDDISETTGNIDSLLEMPIVNTGKQWAVLDYVDVDGAARNFTATVENLGP